MTPTVASLPDGLKEKVVEMVREFTEFTEGDDPFGEHDFGASSSPWHRAVPIRTTSGRPTPYSPRQPADEPDSAESTSRPMPRIAPRLAAARPIASGLNARKYCRSNNRCGQPVGSLISLGLRNPG